MSTGSGGAAHHEGDGKFVFFQLIGNDPHFLQGRRDQAAERDDIRLFFQRGLNDRFRRDHHAQIDNLKIIALQDHTHNIFADVMHIPFDGCQHHHGLAGGFGAL